MGLLAQWNEEIKSYNFVNLQFPNIDEMFSYGTIRSIPIVWRLRRMCFKTCSDSFI